MYLDFELCDRNQNLLTRLDNRRPGGRVELGLNAARKAFVPLSLEDPALELAAAVKTVLRVSLKGEEFSKPLFIGRVVIPERGRSESEDQPGINAIDPLFQLERALIRSAAGATWSAKTFAATDQSAILWALIEAATTHGIVKGSLPASVNRDRTYIPGKDVASALIEMTEVINGPDFELDPTIASDNTLATFNTFYPHQGEDKSTTVRFVFGGDPSTASGFIYAPGGDGVVNRVVVIGAPLNQESESEEANPIATFPGFVAEHLDSITELGVWEQLLQLEDVTEVATMRAHAEALISANAFPVPYFDFTAAAEAVEDGETGDGVPPAFGVDYWIGDTVAITAYMGGEWVDGTYIDDAGNELKPLEVSGRITDAVVTELESGEVQVKSSCSPAPKAEGITGEAITLLIPEVVEE